MAHWTDNIPDSQLTRHEQQARDESQPMNYRRAKAQVIDSMSASFWIKQSLEALELRDCVDAYYDALTLAAIAKRRMDEALRK